MDILWGILLIVFGLIAWGGQVLSTLTPKFAEKLGLIEPEADIDPAFYADACGEAKWDSMTLWTLPLAGIFIILNSPLWIYFGMFGGSMYLYFAGRAIFTRLELRRHGVRIGKPELLKIYFIFVTLWGLIGLATIVKAVKTFM
ncbi:MAG: hypothetical protein DRQ13_00425 [Ignavibacteriae bacterium]|nr:MAG: hypothetical protein DRQ13_00425 [Ignavibacteriota bacterium]